MSARTATRHFATPPEIAVEMGIRPETVVGWIKSGELPAIDVSRPNALRPRFKVRRADLERFWEGRSVRRSTVGKRVSHA